MSLLVPLGVKIHSGHANRVITGDVRSLKFRDTAPGGFATADFELSRGAAIFDLQQFSKVWIYDTQTGEVAWQGWLDDPSPAVGSSGQTWSITASGPAARGEDYNGPMLFLHGNLDNWLKTPNSRQWADVSTSNDPTFPGIKIQFPNGHAVAIGDYGAVNNVLAAYATDPNGDRWELARFVSQFDWDSNSGNYFCEFVTWPSGTIEASCVMDNTEWYTYADLNDIPSGDYVPHMQLVRRTSNGTVTDEYAYVRIFALKVQYKRYRKTGVYETSPSQYADYITADRVINDILGRGYVPAWDNNSALVTTSPTHIDHFNYPNGANPRQALDDLCTLEPGFFWATWEDTAANKSSFEWRQWGTTPRYVADVWYGYSSPQSGTTLYDKVAVRGEEYRGQPAWTFDSQTVQLISDAGLMRQGLLDLGTEIYSSDAATAAATQFLTDHSIPLAGAQVNIPQRVLDRQTGRMIPPYMIRSGYSILLRGIDVTPSRPNGWLRDAVSVFRIVGKDYDAGSGSATLDLDVYPYTLARALATNTRKIDRIRRRW